MHHDDIDSGDQSTSRTPLKVGAVAGVDNNIIELGVGIERIADKIPSPLGASLIRFRIHSQNTTMVTYRLVVPTSEEVPQGLGDLDGQRDRRNDGAYRNARLEGFSERSDRGVDRIDNGIELLPLGCVGHSVNGIPRRDALSTSGWTRAWLSLRATSSWLRKTWSWMFIILLSLGSLGGFPYSHKMYEMNAHECKM